jgi:hypothetical protein
MHEFKHGTLHSGSKSGPLVKNRKQAIAIMLSEKAHESPDADEAMTRSKRMRKPSRSPR